MNNMGVAVNESGPTNKSHADDTSGERPAQGDVVLGNASRSLRTDGEYQDATSSAAMASVPDAGLVPDHDLDAILQNFMQQEQQTDYSASTFPSQLGVSAQFNNGIPADPWIVDYSTFPGDMNGMVGFDDALFGFNTLDFGFYQQGPS